MKTAKKSPQKNLLKKPSTKKTGAKPQSSKVTQKPPLQTQGTFEKLPHSPKELLKFVESIKRQWMATIDALVDPLAIIDRSYRIQKANLAMAKLAGLEVKQVLGKKCYEVFADRKTPCSGCKIAKTKGQRLTQSHLGLPSIHYELEAIRDNRFYEVSSQALTGIDQDETNFVQIYRDRTEARKMRDQLAQQDKLASIGLLAGGIAHEINNPLGGILIFSQMLLKELPKTSSHYQDVVEIEAATQRCKAIVESLLDFARANPLERRQSLTRTSIFEAIRTALRFGRVSIPRSHHYEIEEKFKDLDHFLTCDRNKIIQLFLNLAQNAIQAMPDGGSLTIKGSSYYDKDQKCSMGVYEIEDTGVGINPEHLSRIFDPFFTTKDPGEGTGLGLALCYTIIQDLKGTITVESHVNVGTRFIIKIPLEEVTKAEPLAG